MNLKRYVYNKVLIYTICGDSFLFIVSLANLQSETIVKYIPLLLNRTKKEYFRLQFSNVDYIFALEVPDNMNS